MGRPKFKEDQVIRYASGPTALMRVTSIRTDHAGDGRHLYYGEQCYGGSVGAYERQCSRATKADLAMWLSERERYRLGS